MSYTLKATNNGFHLLNGANKALSPDVLLSTATNHSGNLQSSDGINWSWSLPNEANGYAIETVAQQKDGVSLIDEINLFRVHDGEKVEIGTISLDKPIEVEVEAPFQPGEDWSLNLDLADRMSIQNKAIKFDGGNGVDHFDLSESAPQLHDGMIVNARGGDDVVIGGIGDDLIRGGSGDDKIIDQSGSNKILGGSGNDAIKVTDASSSSVLKGGSGHDVLISGAGDDKLYGGSGNDYLTAGGGDDLLNGGGGKDHIVAGHGKTIMIGGGGKDTFEINTGFTKENIIRDFKAGEDMLLLKHFNGDFDDIEFTQAGDHLQISDALNSFKLTLKNTTEDDISEDDISFE